MRRRRGVADDRTRVIRREEEWPAAGSAPPPPAPPPDAAPEPPPGPPPGWLAVENPWPWLLLVLLAVAALLIWLFAFRNDDKTTVPRVVGLQQQAAITRLNEDGFDVTAVRRPGKPPAGRVFAQKPGAGSRLKKGQNVVIDVSNGVPAATAPAATTSSTPTTTVAAPQVTIADATGKAQADAGAELEAAGLVPDTFPTPASRPSGTVVSQDPAAGTKLAAGRSVRLNVSTGGGAQPNVTIPDVVGRKAADARAALWKAKLTVRTVYDNGTVGVVLREQPGAGGKAPAFSQVTVVVGR